MFSDYKPSLDIVKLVMLAHLEYFAGALLNLFAALSIGRGHEILRLTKIARRLDNLGTDNPAVDAEFITRNIIEIDDVDPEIRVYSHVGVLKKFG